MDSCAGQRTAMPKESSNANDPYAVAVMKEDNVVGHVPRHISAACSLFIQKGGRILCTVQALRRYSVDLPPGWIRSTLYFEIQWSGENRD